MAPKSQIVIAAVLMTVAGGLIAWVFIRAMLQEQSRHRSFLAKRAARVAELDKLIERIKRGDVLAYHEILACNSGDNPWFKFVWGCRDLELSARYESAMRMGEQLSNYETVLAATRKVLEEHHDNAPANDRIKSLVALLRAIDRAYPANKECIYAELGIRRSRLVNSLNRALDDHCYELLERAKRGDSSAFLLLDALIRDTRRTNYRSGSEFLGLGVAPLVRPDEWNNLVVRLFDNPDLALFNRDEMAPGDVLHLAARAEASGSLVDMQLALAFHNANKQASELPGELVASLVRKVVAQLAARNTATDN